MCTSRRAWAVASAVGAVEALKDQGFCRWNYTLRSLHQQARNQVRSLYQAQRRLPLMSSAPDDKLKQAEESLRKVMFLSCWAPN
ncbi:uncharacterized protein LOC120289504 [Eucalyptus grandis]|uniref:uncharacterized protein LOC120289504 n=1 Tax=Eucalyptus grandis TaxID=71139 RepID=UPI00192EE366|nr:uncharacterized protein LOC120289504 [Eucalyptus grandis]